MKLSTTGPTPDNQLGATLTSPPESTSSLSRLTRNCKLDIVAFATLSNRFPHDRLSVCRSVPLATQKTIRDGPGARQARIV